ncbi:MAG TPA: MCP four helix bundle domain-containing protein, partial [Geobacteraceae bacterium]|nr:MCP four helix bundle domain-containing protein [Geobacteraceae bacterium]
MLKNLKIGKRLGIGFGVMLFLILLVGITGYWGVNESTTTTINMIR